MYVVLAKSRFDLWCIPLHLDNNVAEIGVKRCCLRPKIPPKVAWLRPKKAATDEELAKVVSTYSKYIPAEAGREKKRVLL